MLPEQPLVSIIIPAYQGQQRIARAVNSVLAQDYTNVEIIVVSDDQQDYEKILSTQGVRNTKIKFQTTGRVGASAGNARNVGLDHANGDVMAMLDCDDALDTQYLSTMLPLVRKYGAAVCQLELIDEATGRVLANLNQLSADEQLLPHQVIRRCFHGMNAIVYDRSKIPQRYLNLLKNDDYLFLMQMFNVLPCTGYCPQPLYKYFKYHGSSTTFSNNPQEIADVFTSVAILIKQGVQSGEIVMNTENLKQAIYSGFDLYIGAQKYFVEQTTKNPNAKFHEIMGPFLSGWPD